MTASVPTNKNLNIALWVLQVLLAAVFLMGVHSAIFGPSKYGLLPELLPERKLSWGNGVLELGTFVAIIGGAGRSAERPRRLDRVAAQRNAHSRRHRGRERATSRPRGPLRSRPRSR